MTHVVYNCGGYLGYEMLSSAAMVARFSSGFTGLC